MNTPENQSEFFPNNRFIRGAMLGVFALALPAGAISAISAYQERSQYQEQFEQTQDQQYEDMANEQITRMIGGVAGVVTSGIFGGMLTIEIIGSHRRKNEQL